MTNPIALPFDVLCAHRAKIGESPIWSVSEQCLYWVDIEGRSLQRFEWANQRLSQWALGERAGSIALRSRGGLLAAMESGIFYLDLGAEGKIDVERVHPISFPRADMRFNDGRCDRSGRFWVSSMVLDTGLGIPAGGLFRVDERGLTGPLFEGLMTGNGLAFSPDGHILYLAESNRSVQKIWAFDLSTSGEISGQRIFADFAPLPGRPDGAAVDAEGCYWVCATDAGQIHRFTPEGILERSLRVPFAKPTTCVFGGPDLDQLLVASLQTAKPVEGFDPDLAGAVIAMRPGIKGLPESQYGH
jgi:sugar lactone lactonase YvrE